MRTIVIGDVHGCYDELRALLYKTEYKVTRDRLILVGDLVDKGPDSFAVVQYLSSINAEVVMGNHDEKFVRFHKHELLKSAKPNYKNPMKFNEEKLLLYDDLVAFGLIEWMSDFKPYIAMDTYVIVHGGLVPGVPLGAQDPKQTIRLRYIHKVTGKMLSLTDDLKQPPCSVYWTDVYAGPSNVIYGHTAHSLGNPAIECSQHACTFGIDTGCAYGGHLTALVFEETGAQPRVVQVKAAMQYAPYYEGEEAA